MLADLHIHTFYSADGTGTPADAFALAAEAGVRWLALSEHNTVAHIPGCLELARQFPTLRYAPSAEISCTITASGIQEVHFLCFFPIQVRPAWVDPALGSFLRANAERQHINLQRTAALLSLSDEEVRGIISWCIENRVIHPSAPSSVYHLKRYFQLNYPNNYYEHKVRRKAAVEVLKEEGGWEPYLDVQGLSELADELGMKWFLAHPWRYGWEAAQVEANVANLCAMGMSGVETHYHPMRGRTVDTLALAGKYRLHSSSGSDTHDVTSLTIGRYADLLREIEIEPESLAWLSAIDEDT